MVERDPDPFQLHADTEVGRSRNRAGECHRGQLRAPRQLHTNPLGRNRDAGGRGDPRRDLEGDFSVDHGNVNDDVARWARVDSDRRAKRRIAGSLSNDHDRRPPFRNQQRDLRDTRRRPPKRPRPTTLDRDVERDVAGGDPILLHVQVGRHDLAADRDRGRDTDQSDRPTDGRHPRWSGKHIRNRRVRHGEALTDGMHGQRLARRADDLHDA